MITKIKCKNIIDNGKIFDGNVYYQDGKIIAVTNADLPFDEQIDVGENYLCSGFVDIHTHGAVGCDFTFCNAHQIAQACDYHFEHGVTTIVPTTLASDFSNTQKAIQNVLQAKSKTKGNIAGVHIEGPYFSPEMAGAQNTKYLTAPIAKDYVALVEQFGNFIKKWSYAPERDTNAQFCKYLLQHGIVPSAGHTNATFDDVTTAYNVGLRNVTHLYSCTSTITRVGGFRQLGVTESAYFYDDMLVEIIADGCHLPRQLINLVFKLKKVGTVMVVSDSLSIAGSSQTCGSLNGVDYVVEDGVAKLSDKTAFAGSISTLDQCVQQCVAAGVPLAKAVMAANQTPSQSLGLYTKGRIAVGFDADFVILNKDLLVTRVICHKN